MLGTCLPLSNRYESPSSILASGDSPQGFKSQKVIIEKVSKTGAKRSTRRENVTVVAMVDAAGVYLLFLFTRKGKQGQLA